VKNGSKSFWLCLILEIVNANGGEKQQDHCNAEEENDFFSRDQESAMKTANGHTISSQLENAKQTKQAKRPEGAEVNAGRDVERENCHEIYNAEETSDESNLIVGNDNSEDVLDSEDDDCDEFDRVKQVAKSR
jgi:hypothetical protein